MMEKDTTQQQQSLIDTSDKPGTIRTVILTLAIAFLVLGVRAGGAVDVWSKAVMICRECVGLG